MEKTNRPCFSNGTEVEWWFERNCERCIKFPKEGTSFRCAVARDLFEQYMGYGNETISSRSWEATQGNRCPYIKTEWPKRKKKDKDKSLKYVVVKPYVDFKNIEDVTIIEPREGSDIG